MTATYGSWKPTPWWLRLIGKPAYCRSVYASWMAGGGWDGFEYSETEAPTPAVGSKKQEGHIDG